MGIKVASADFQLRYCFTMPKVEGSDPNEDCWAIDRTHGRYALSDGASVSFDSAGWARLLTRGYVRHVHQDRTSLSRLINKYASAYPMDQLSWSAQAAFQRGSFASLLGIRHMRSKKQIHIDIIGDTLGVLCDKFGIVTTFPYDRPEQFTADPRLVSTNLAQNRFRDDSCLAWEQEHTFPLDDDKQPQLLCMTDALGRWLLEGLARGDAPHDHLCSIRTLEEFRRFVEGERSAGRMRRDDTTLMTFW